MTHGHTGVWIAFTALLGFGLACSGGDLASQPGGSGLRPNTALESACVMPPFSKRNRTDVQTFLEAGDRAVDFTLKTVDGAKHTLSTLLADSPVLLVQGSHTCPRYQEERPGISELAKKFHGQLRVVTVYNIEAHPPAGVPNPYAGKPKPRGYSTVDQPKTYAQRVANARKTPVSKAELQLVDALSPEYANPVWCTYGTCPSCSWLIRQDGVIEAVHLWHDKATMEQSIKALLSASRD